MRNPKSLAGLKQPLLNTCFQPHVTVSNRFDWKVPRAPSALVMYAHKCSGKSSLPLQSRHHTHLSMSHAQQHSHTQTESSYTPLDQRLLDLLYQLRNLPTSLSDHSSIHPFASLVLNPLDIENYGSAQGCAQSPARACLWLPK